MVMTRFVVLFLLGIFTTQTFAQRTYLNGTVLKVTDGDTCLVLAEGDEIKIRLFGIDAPESDQPYGDMAAEFLRDELVGELITALIVDEDPYGRKVCEIFVNGASINRELVASGLAWWYEQYAEHDYDLYRLQEAAKVAGDGLWQETDPIAPWDWRRGSRPQLEHANDPALFVAELFADKSGDALIELLREQYSPTHTFGYRTARHHMFSIVDNDDGSVTLVYTGVEFPTNGIPDHSIVNTEHTWPQSKFSKAGGAMKTDIHHLFPVFAKVNSSRGNESFQEIPDPNTKGWWVSRSKQTTIPPIDERDEYSERGPNGFEPREDHKGNVARAMFYFYTIYGDDSRVHVQWFILQIPTLQQWHDKDPVDAMERRRSKRIAELQGNHNPFVLDESLLDRVAETLTE